MWKVEEPKTAGENMIELVDKSDVRAKYGHKEGDEELIKRIWDNIDKRGDNDCWPWTGSRSIKGGYGKIGINGKSVMAHRMVYILTHGKISEDIPYVTHTCNNPPCCNPKHLKADTPKGNSQYMANCERQAKGENNGSSKLTQEEVNEIRNLYNTGEYSYEMLAAMFGLAKSTISLIIENKTWKDENYKRMHDTKIGRERSSLN